MLLLYPGELYRLLGASSLFHFLIFFNQLHATFLQLHIFIVWSLCAVSTGIVNKYIYETCGCEPLTVIFQSSEISNFVDLRKNKMKEWVSNFGKCMRHRNVHREDTRFKDIVNRTCNIISGNVANNFWVVEKKKRVLLLIHLYFFFFLYSDDKLKFS